MTPEERQAKFKAAHPGRAAIYNARYYAKKKAEITARNVAWRLANPDKVRAQQRAWRNNNPDKAREKARQWYARHREAQSERHADYMSQRRATRHGGRVFTVIPRDRRRLLARYRNECVYCGSRGKIVFDHVIPLTRGGSHGVGNLAPSCIPCNRAKGTRLLTEWRASLRRAV